MTPPVPPTARLRGSALWLVAVVLAGCGGEAPPAAGDFVSARPETEAVPAAEAAPVPKGSLEAVAVELGVALDAEGRVAIPVDRVRPSDAVHLSLVTVGQTEAAMLAVRWRDATGTVLAEDERAVSAQGPAVHTFSRKPEAGWPPGRYEVEVSLAGQSAGVRAFEVR